MSITYGVDLHDEYGVYIKNVNDAIAPFAIGDSGYHGFNPPRSFGLEFSYSR